MTTENNGLLPNTWQAPNFIVDSGILALIDGAEAKCLIVCQRKILGWEDKRLSKQDHISVSQLVELTGLNRATVIKKMKELEKANLVRVISKGSGTRATLWELNIGQCGPIDMEYLQQRAEKKKAKSKGRIENIRTRKPSGTSDKPLTSGTSDKPLAVHGVNRLAVHGVNTQNPHKPTIKPTNNNATASQGVSAQPQPHDDIDFPEPKPRKQHTPESIREDTANAIAEFEKRNGRLRESPWAEIIRDASILAVADSFTKHFSYTFAVPNSNRLRRQCVDGFKQIYDEAGSAEIAERLLAELARRHKRKQDGYTFTINGPHSIVKSLPRLKAELKRKEGRNGDKNGCAKPLTQWQTEPTAILGWDGAATVER